jgi:hypothetical protein
MKDEWVSIPNWEGYYKVNRLGVIISEDRIVTGKSGIDFNVKGRIMTCRINDQGYYSVGVRKPNYKTNIPVHRAIALAFIPNPENKPCINHINGIKTDNRIENLEWCTHSENNKHALDIGLRKTPEHVYKSGDDSNKSISVIKFDVFGNYIKKYGCMKLAAKDSNTSPCGIRMCCNKDGVLAGGFQWRWYESNKSVKFIGVAKNRVLLMFNKNGEFINKFTSPKEAERFTGVSSGSISRCTRGLATSAGGYLWTYL